MTFSLKVIASFVRRSAFGTAVMAALAVVISFTDACHAMAASVDLTESQRKAVNIERVISHTFRIEKQVTGNVAYNEKADDRTAHRGNASKDVIANVPESDSPKIRVGQPVKAKAMVYPDRIFQGQVTALGVTVYDASDGNPALDPNTHRIAVRCQIEDPKNELYPGMLADITIQEERPVESLAVAQNGVVREGDGTMTVWVTSDGTRFEQRMVKVGLVQDGYDQILEGLKEGETVATDGALFLDNAFASSQ